MNQYSDKASTCKTHTSTWDSFSHTNVHACIRFFDPCSSCSGAFSYCCYECVCLCVYALLEFFSIHVFFLIHCFLHQNYCDYFIPFAHVLHIFPLSLSLTRSVVPTMFPPLSLSYEHTHVQTAFCFSFIVHLFGFWVDFFFQNLL